MGRLNEFIARAANKEYRVKGRFWESRFKCQALLDEAAIAACMIYVDLNPIRAGRADTPEESDFTSIQERIRAWQKETMTTASTTGETGAQDTQPEWISKVTAMPLNTAEVADGIPNPISAAAHSLVGTADPARWLCPIQSDSEGRGILHMTAAEYFDLVDKSGRMIRADKRGAMDADLAPILLRIGANPEAWMDTVSRFGSKFRLAAGLLSNLRSFAEQLGRHWLKGVAAARAAFASSPPQLA
jgi:hypothetical protein